MQSPPHHCLQPLLRLLKQCKTVAQLQSLHAQVLLHALPLSPSSLLFSFSNLLSLPSSSSSAAAADYAAALFRLIPSPSSFPFNLLIRSLTLLSFPHKALRFFLSMRRSSVLPDSHTFPFTLTACSHLAGGGLRLGRALHSQAFKFGFAADLFVGNALITMYSGDISGGFTDARRVFDEIPRRDVITYNSMIDGYVKAGLLALARRLFDEMSLRDVVSWGTLLAGYSQASRFGDALELFDRMMELGVEPDDVALVAVLSCCGHVGALERGERIHRIIEQKRVSLNVYLATGLVDMYAKCGHIGVARKVFESSSQRNLFTWNAMIVGLAMHGHGKLSLEYFERMRHDRVWPDGVTFLGVLVGCSHAGLVDTARRLFNEMQQVYRVEPELKHYGCMADLLARAGFIEEVMEMIDDMPMKGDVYVWGGVLGGCRLHGNVEVAEIAAEHLLELKPKESGIYSIMSEIYANAGRWEDVERIRKMMNDRNVRKNVGCSFIQVNAGGDAAFCMED